MMSLRGQMGTYVNPKVRPDHNRFRHHVTLTEMPVVFEHIGEKHAFGLEAAALAPETGKAGPGPTTFQNLPTPMCLKTKIILGTIPSQITCFQIFSICFF